MNFWQAPAATLRSLWRRRSPRLRQLRHWYSPTLEREVDLDIYLPPDYRNNTEQRYPLVIFNDGQDLPRMGFADILARLYREERIPYLIAVGIHCGPERIREYGTARQPDYKNRGDKAGLYKEFVLDELMPFLNDRFRISQDTDETAIAGFSLGGLSALDIGWATPNVFGNVGVFSGALWWRWADVSDADPDANRIMHDVILNSPDERPTDQYFWFEVGTDDEEEDRNNNGVIDAIDDTIDCIRALQQRGYNDERIRYIELEDGTHDPETWGQAMPDFLIWTFNP